MTKWVVDNAHSEVGFQVKHMMVSKVKGTFDQYEAHIEAEDLTDLTNASISFEIDVSSINTKNEDRDKHLKSTDFFDVDKYPKITFQSTAISGSYGHYNVTGDLTIKDVTRPVTFEINYNGMGKNPWGIDVYGFEAETSINREEFNLTWNAPLETGGILVGKDVKITVELEVTPSTVQV